MKNNFNSWMIVIVANVIIAVLITGILLGLLYQLNVDAIVDYVQLNTKIFLLITFLISGYVMIFSQFQINLALRLLENPKYGFWIKKIYSFTVLFLLALTLNFTLEYFQGLKEIAGTIDWIQINTRVFLLGSFYLFFIGLSLFALIGRLYVTSLILALSVLTLGVLHGNKLQFLGEPLYPSDFTQIAHFTDVLKMVSGYISPQLMIYSLLAVLITIFAYKQLQEVKITLLSRVVVSSLAFYMVFAFTFHPSSFMKKVVEDNNVNIIQWNQLKNYQKNGFVFGYLSNLNHETFEKPANYNRKKIQEIALSILADGGSTPASFSDKGYKRPNIIFLMNETFWDPTKLDVSFSEDPMPHVRNYMNEHTSGSVLTPSFGGQTANVEYEALTGFSMSTLQSGAVPYQQLIDKKSSVPSLASMLKTKGYKTIALHPYNKAFYKRARVYKAFGFDDFISIEEMKHKEISGSYISDESVTDEIVMLLEESKQPLFVHAVTMQNHFPYRTERYDENTIEVSGLENDLKSEVEIYAEGIKQADAATNKLIEFVSTLEEPTVIVFWGDHLPILGQNKAVFKELNYGDILKEEEDYRSFHETPLFMYSNVDTERKDLNSISPAFIGPTLFEIMNMDLPPYYQFLAKLKGEIAGLAATTKIDPEGKEILKLTEKQEELLKQYEMLQYDLLVGKQYSLELLFEETIE
ncbi:LTA synthase family protein [Halalkalibacter akibai]|uniref:Cyclic beta-1,2-glucan modification transmembrane protein n=1 Tax=Halalkalibacter akibai (strain ATCC 43226 / DSM 21942 / CIP 109018 / JCM 9157 / 1139) TaxID=1236973 RepID=W4QUM1_HALA3|nr:alkaline phosphatase family protein [Halalkalibacter akibai]GAE35781.1 cyclic beta-1,2-glucan modification transmembrane protein [Halalkalibacter akibai JCM 9157]